MEPQESVPVYQETSYEAGEFLRALSGGDEHELIRAMVGAGLMAPNRRLVEAAAFAVTHASNRWVVHSGALALGYVARGFGRADSRSILAMADRVGPTSAPGGFHTLADDAGAAGLSLHDRFFPPEPVPADGAPQVVFSDEELRRAREAYIEEITDEDAEDEWPWGSVVVHRQNGVRRLGLVSRWSAPDLGESGSEGYLRMTVLAARGTERTVHEPDLDRVENLGAFVEFEDWDRFVAHPETIPPAWRDLIDDLPPCRGEPGFDEAAVTVEPNFGADVHDPFMGAVAGADLAALATALDQAARTPIDEVVVFACALALTQAADPAIVRVALRALTVLAGRWDGVDPVCLELVWRRLRRCPDLAPDLTEMVDSQLTAGSWLPGIVDP